MHYGSFCLAYLPDKAWDEMGNFFVTPEDAQVWKESDYVKIYEQYCKLGVDFIRNTPGSCTVEGMRRQLTRSNKCCPLFCNNPSAHWFNTPYNNSQFPTDVTVCLTLTRMQDIQSECCPSNDRLFHFLQDVKFTQYIRVAIHEKFEEHKTLCSVKRVEYGHGKLGLICHWLSSIHDFLRLKKGYPECRVLISECVTVRTANPNNNILLYYLLRNMELNFTFHLLPDVTPDDAFSRNLESRINKSHVHLLVMSPEMYGEGGNDREKERGRILLASFKKFARPSICIAFDAGSQTTEHLRQLDCIKFTLQGELNQSTSSDMEKLLRLIVFLFSTRKEYQRHFVEPIV